jgi:hypothetical protein
MRIDCCGTSRRSLKLLVIPSYWTTLVELRRFSVFVLEDISYFADEAKTRRGRGRCSTQKHGRLLCSQRRSLAEAGYINKTEHCPLGVRRPSERAKGAFDAKSALLSKTQPANRQCSQMRKLSSATGSTAS